MKKWITNLLRKNGVLLATLALTLATVTANSTCFYYSCQPDEPKGLSKLKK